MIKKRWCDTELLLICEIIGHPPGTSSHLLSLFSSRAAFPLQIMLNSRFLQSGSHFLCVRENAKENGKPAQCGGSGWQAGLSPRCLGFIRHDKPFLFNYFQSQFGQLQENIMAWVKNRPFHKHVLQKPLRKKALRTNFSHVRVNIRSRICFTSYGLTVFNLTLTRGDRPMHVCCVSTNLAHDIHTTHAGVFMPCKKKKKKKT